MSFRWQIPSPPPDAEALERLHYFSKPTSPMPEAWFMGGDVNFFTWMLPIPPKTLIKDSNLIGTVLGEIGGLIAFPEIEYVKEWREWFLYLLPYILAEPEDFLGYKSILAWTIPYLMAIYPDGITEEYKGFRDDLVYLVGMRVISDVIPHSVYYDDNTEYPLVHDFWDDVNYARMQLPSVDGDFSLSMFFCLKYLMLPEIESWVQSITSMESPYWQLAFIRWWLAFNQFLNSAKNWPKNGNMGHFFEQADRETGPLVVSRISQIEFESLDAFLSNENRVAFKSALDHHLTFDLFQTWVENIKSQGRFSLNGSLLAIDELGPYYKISFENLFQDFELIFFHHLT